VLFPTQLLLLGDPVPFGSNPPTFKCEALALGCPKYEVSVMLDNSQDGQISSYQRSLCQEDKCIIVVNASIQKRGKQTEAKR